MSNLGQQKGVTVPSHRAGIGAGDSESVLIPRQFGPISEWINKHIRSLHTPHGSGICYDFIVAASWADEVTAGRGSEGQEIATGTGGTTKVYSALFGDTGALADAYRLSTGPHIWVCPGHTETITAPWVPPLNWFANVTVESAPQERGRSQAYTPKFTATGASMDEKGLIEYEGTITSGSGLSFTGLSFTGFTGRDVSFFRGARPPVWTIQFDNCVIHDFYSVLRTGTGIKTIRLWNGEYIFDGPISELTTTSGGGAEGSVLSVKNSRLTAQKLMGGGVSGGHGWVNCELIGNEYIFLRDDAIDYAAESDAVHLRTMFLRVIGNTIIHGNPGDVDGATPLFNMDQSYLKDVRNITITDNLYMTTQSECYFLRMAVRVNQAVVQGNILHYWGGGVADNACIYVGPTSSDVINISIGPNVYTDDANGSWPEDVTGPGAPGAVVVVGGGLLTPVLYDAGGIDIGWGDFTVRFDNNIVSVSADTLTLTDNGTNYLEVDSSGTVSANTTGFTLRQIPLGTVVCASADISSITEQTAALDETGAPKDAQYLTLALDGDLSAERRFVPGTGLTAVDGGAGGDYTLSVDNAAGIISFGFSPLGGQAFNPE